MIAKWRHRFCLMVMALIVQSTPALADPADAASVAQANAGTVGVISGGVDGTYVRIAADLASVLDSDQLRVLAILGKGSLQNISDILYVKGIDIGIVQADALAYIKRQHLYPGIEQSIQYITKLYDEEIHILVRSNITGLDQLNEQKVNVDVVGSGTAMTAAVLFDIVGVKPQLVNDSQDDALEKLRRGDIAALVFVTGKPARLFAGLGPGTGLHFLPISLSKQLLDNYLPAEFTHVDYPNLIPEGQTVDTAAVGSVMAVYAWQPGTVRYTKVARFVNAFFSKFQLLLKPPRHPKWQEVNLAAQVPGWTRFGPAEDWLRQQAVASGATASGKDEFNLFLAHADGGPGSLTDAQKSDLFRQFLDWRSRQHMTQ